ncbi:MAG: flagellar hook-length control protein FliK [Planctomycetia bacterium]|nr:MAG: flagellar hook-length control protein FliK [Planctomycetia bacterium]
MNPAIVSHSVTAPPGSRARSADDAALAALLDLFAPPGDFAALLREGRAAADDRRELLHTAAEQSRDSQDPIRTARDDERRARPGTAAADQAERRTAERREALHTQSQPEAGDSSPRSGASPSRESSALDSSPQRATIASDRPSATDTQRDPDGPAARLETPAAKPAQSEASALDAASASAPTSHQAGAQAVSPNPVAATPATDAAAASRAAARIDATTAARAADSASPRTAAPAADAPTVKPAAAAPQTPIAASAVSPDAQAAQPGSRPARTAPPNGGSSASHSADTDATIGKDDPNIERIVRLVATRVGRDHSTATLRLDPPWLGSIRMKIDLRANELELRVEADSPLAHRLLSENLDALRTALESSGIQLARVKFIPPGGAAPGDWTPGQAFPDAAADGTADRGAADPGRGDRSSGDATPAAAGVVSQPAADAATAASATASAAKGRVNLVI